MSSRRDIRISRPTEEDVRLIGCAHDELVRPRPWMHHDYRLPVVRELPRRHPDDGVGETW
jgi:hypothetical protein